MRSQALSIAAIGVLALSAAAAADAPAPPLGNFGGGALVPPPRAIFGAGNAVVAVRALPKRRLEIDATVRAACAGGDIAATTKLTAAGRFSAKGTETQDPAPGVTIKAHYALAGRFTSATAGSGTISATIEQSVEGKATSCKTGTVKFAIRRPVTGIGTAGAPKAARYYGTTTQRGTGPDRPILMRVSSDGRRLTRGLFGESTKCSDGKLTVGLEAPSTNVSIDAHGRVRDHEHFSLIQGETVVHVNDHFTAQLGSKGARGTLSLSDRTADRASGNTIQSCKSGTVHWRASR